MLNEKLTEIKKMIAAKLSESGFKLKSLFIEIGEDNQYAAHMTIEIEPGILRTTEEKEIDDQFESIIGDLK